jgi:hypothetical protein
MARQVQLRLRFKYLRRMRCLPLRLAAASALIFAGAAACAETYTAMIYSSPPGYPEMYVLGAGDNGMMTGLVDDGSGVKKAAYRTSSGYKIMHPAGWYDSRINDSWGATYHTGYGKTTSGALEHALFWVGGGPGVDLHPAGAEYQLSEAFGGFDQFQVGTVGGNINCDDCGVFMLNHAGIWNRTAASFKRLHSLTHKETYAFGTDGIHHVGVGQNRADGSYNALLWNDTNSMGKNIRPSMSTSSQAIAVWGNQQGGFYTSVATGGSQHAVIWAGTAASALDLNPNGVFVSSTIKAVRNGLQVGSANPSANPAKYQAIAWHGSAATWINLHSKLPAPFQLWHSFAEGIDNLGNITGYVGNSAGTDVRPVVWVRS